MAVFMKVRSCQDFPFVTLSEIKIDAPTRALPCLSVNLPFIITLKVD
jgi:hypothetical protein